MVTKANSAVLGRFCEVSFLVLPSLDGGKNVTYEYCMMQAEKV